MKSKYKRAWARTLPAVALRLIITVWLLPSLGQGGTVAEPQEGTPNAKGGVWEPDTWAKYQIIVQRNIFSRQRSPIRPMRDEKPRPVVTRNPESYLLLKGIVQENDIFIAFIEDGRNNTALKFYAGDSVARGIVKNFTLDSIEYQREDKTVKVMLGRDLEGGQGTIPMSRLLELSATSSSSGDPNAAAEKPTPSPDEAEILRRLMEQRKQQLGQ